MVGLLGLHLQPSMSGFSAVAEKSWALMKALLSWKEFSALAHGVLQDHLMEDFTAFQSSQNTHGTRECLLPLQGFHAARDSADAD